MGSRAKNVIILGAGVFGISAANHLHRELDSDAFNVKLVAVSDYVYFLPSAVRLTVSKDYTKSIMPLKIVLDDGIEVIKGKVISFNDRSVELESAEAIEFDILIIATGSQWSDPISSTSTFGNDYEAYFERMASQILDAKHIVFIGGGFVNCELVGELLFQYSDEISSGKKRISIIHNSDKLLPDSGIYSDTLRRKVTDYITESGVKLYLNTVGTSSETLPNRIFLDKNSSNYIDADLIYRSVGILPSVPSSEFSDLCDKKGFIRVEKNFQVKGVTAGNVFAIGDVTNFRYHGLIKRNNWVDVLTRNVVSFLRGGKNAVFVDADSFESGHPPTGVSLGPNVGFAQMPLPLLGTIFVPSFIVSKVKSKELLSHKMESVYKK